MEINSVAQKYIDEIQNFSSYYHPLVVVRCITYNHELYIRDALEGFVAQKTNFPFIVIIHDDASTDGTVEIIREYATKYPTIIKPILEEENQYSKKNGSLSRIMRVACDSTGAKYLAMCEGDDYWIDPLKLQKQIDFLEANPNYGMCYTNFDIYREDSGLMIKSVFDSRPNDYQKLFSTPEQFVIRAGYVCPPSWVVRRELFPTDVLGSTDGTFVYFTHFLVLSKVAYLNFRSCVYRILRESASHTNDFHRKIRRENNLLETQLKLIDKYQLDKSIIRICEEKYYERNLMDLIINRRTEEIKQAKKVLKGKSHRYKVLFMINDLGLYRLLPLMKKIRKLFKT